MPFKDIKKKRASGLKSYYKAMSDPVRPGLQTLCGSCQLAKVRNGGILPESRRKLTPDEWFEKIGVGGI